MNCFIDLGCLLSSMYLLNASIVGRMWHKINFYAE